MHATPDLLGLIIRPQFEQMIQDNSILIHLLHSSHQALLGFPVYPSEQASMTDQFKVPETGILNWSGYLIVTKV